jgi:hypothetical protein
MDGYREGQKVYVEQSDGSQRPAVFVGQAQATWFGGPSGVYVAYPDTRSAEEVDAARVIPREDG